MGDLVLIVGRDPTRHAGGAESYMVAYALAAREAGYEPHMFVVGRRGESRIEPFGRLHVVRSPVGMTISHWSVLHGPWMLPAVVGFLRDRPGPHVIAAHSTWNWTAVAAREQLAEVGVNARVLAAFYASVEHEQSAKNKGALVRSNPIRRLLYSLALAWVRAVAAPAEGRGYRRADVVVLSYENVRRLLAQAHGPNPRVRRIAYCAPLAFRPDAAFVERPLADSGAAPLILTVSRHSPRKGLDVLIRALAQLRDRGVPFRAEVVGRGVLLGAHRQLVRELGLEAHVAVPGGVPDPLPYLRTCEVFVLPTTAEDSGSVSVLEAMQVGAPIVASAVDGLPEDLTHDDNALLVPPSDVPALAEALTRLLGDDELRRRLSRASRATYEARFTPERAAADFARACMDLGLSPVNPARALVTGE